MDALRGDDLGVIARSLTDASQGRAELEATIHAEALAAYEHAMQDRAAALKALLGGNRAALDAKVRAFQGYP